MRYKRLSTKALMAALIVSAVAATGSAARGMSIETVSFPTNVVSGTTNDRPVQLEAKLFLPDDPKLPLSVIVITPSSGGVEEEREIYYAKALVRAGIASLVVDSFGSRGVKNSIYDQRLVESWDSENDAIAALRWLTADPRFDPDRIGILGVSKGGSAAMNTALTVRRAWAGIGKDAFAVHVAISPDCTWINRSRRTTGAPIFFMLAEHDDQTPSAACIKQAERLRQGGNSNITVKIYPGTYHAWEELGDGPEYDPEAENYRRCRVWVEDDGSMVSAVDGERVPEKRWHSWAEQNCMTHGTHCCGGTIQVKEKGTRDIIRFLKKNGF